MKHHIRISTASRLHFGLLRFAQQEGPSYGGLGMMIARPRIVISLRKSAQWRAYGPMANRAVECAKQALAKWRIPNFPALEIQVLEAPPPHSGLGSGTQLALAIARGIRSLGELPDLDVAELGQAVGRGGRSAVGSYGFQRGGLIWETGYLPGEPLGQLVRCLTVPESWRVLLIAPYNQSGLHGKQESEAFLKLPPVPEETTARLEQLAEDQILPACEQANFPVFAEAIFQYGHLAGSCFKSVQGGPYATAHIEACIARLRESGIAGVGQSSWGPTVFAFCADQTEAEELAEKLSQYEEFAEATISISPPANYGAKIL